MRVVVCQLAYLISALVSKETKMSSENKMYFKILIAGSCKTKIPCVHDTVTSSCIMYDYMTLHL